MATIHLDLQQALETLPAVTLGPAQPCRHLATCTDPQDCGMARRFAYFYRPTQRWHVCGRTALLSLASVTDRDGGTWEAISAKKMPTWWAPEHRTTYRDTRDGSTAPAAWVSQGCTPFAALAHHYERITVDLESGTEVPA